MCVYIYIITNVHARACAVAVVYLNLTTTGSDRISSFFFHPDKVIDFFFKERAPARTNYCGRPIVIQLRTIYTTQL